MSYVLRDDVVPFHRNDNFLAGPPRGSSQLAAPVSSTTTMTSETYPIQGRARILDFAFEVPVLAGASPHPPEVETQHDPSCAPHSAGEPVNHLVVHCSAMPRMRMADHCCLDGTVLLWLFEQCLQPAGRTGYEEALESPRHQFER